MNCKLLLPCVACLLCANLRAQQPHLIMPIGHAVDITSIAISPDDKEVLTADGNSVKLWEAATGILLADLPGTTFSSLDVFFSADGSQFLIRGFDYVRLFDTRTAQLIKTFANGDIKVRFTKFSPDGKKIMIAYFNGDMQIYDAATAKSIASWPGADNPGSKASLPGDIFKILIRGAEYGPDGKAIAMLPRRARAPVIRDDVTGKLLVAMKPLPADTVGADPGYDGLKYSPDGKRLIAFRGEDSSFVIWSATTGQVLGKFSIAGENDEANFSPDGQRITTLAPDGTATVWSAVTAKPLARLRDSSDIKAALFSLDGKSVITVSDRKINTWSATGTEHLRSLDHEQRLSSRIVLAERDGQLAVSGSDNSVSIFDGTTLNRSMVLKGHSPTIWRTLFTRDKQQVAFITEQGIFSWDTASSRLTGRYPVPDSLYFGNWSPSGNKVFAFNEHSADVLDAATGRILATLAGYNSYMSGVEFSPDGSRILAATHDSAVRVWDARTGIQLYALRQAGAAVTTADFNPDGADLLTAFHDTLRVWDATKGSLRFTLPFAENSIAEYSPDGKNIITLAADDHSLRQWDAKTGQLKRTLINGDSIPARLVKYSPDGKNIFLGISHYPLLCDSSGGHLRLLEKARGYTAMFRNDRDLVFSDDGKKLLLMGLDSMSIFDVGSGHRLCLITTPGMNRYLQFSPDGKTLWAAADDNTVKIFDAENGKLRYSILMVGNGDYLAYDPDGRYDGSEAARKLVYYSCGTEIVSLDQVKDQLWVPGLARRIDHRDPINALKLTDLRICGFTPIVTEISSAKDTGAWHFVIQPQAGGLGTTIVYVNGNETRRYKPQELKKIPGITGLRLTIPRSELKDVVIPGQANPITVRAFTTGDELVSRGATVTSHPDSTKRPVPNLYAVMVGVSDYKGTELDLKYAAKDASNLSHAIGEAAGKWLGRDHVFMFDLTTDANHYRQPEKAAIRQTLIEIGQKATSSDILLIFFAGHGVMAGNPKKQFYFLTADASASTATGDGSVVAEVGISAQELTDWIQPSRIKAQKRILILDACNSGQAINDIVHIGQSDQNYTAARSDDKAEEIRSIDKLNERSGLFILAASASSQSAYEMSRYSQGLLTYALLKTVKDDPTILENDRYLSVGPWFDHAARTVAQLVRDNGARQDPQIVTTTQFDIGIVDSTVRTDIHLSGSGSGTLFTSSNFSNTDLSAGGDDLDLSTAINQALTSLSSRGPTTTPPAPEISYIPATSTTDAWRLMGNYTNSADSTTVTVNIWKNKKNLFHFTLTAPLSKPDKLASAIIDQSLTWIAAQQQK